MFPLFPFVVGVATGVVALRVAKNERTRKALVAAQEKLKEAGESGLAAAYKLTDKAKARLAGSQEEPPVKKPVSRRKPAAKKTSSKAPAKKAASKRVSAIKTENVEVEQ
ncbi:MAG: hypothetical protein LRY61_06265 [Burkholderiaceae bacterium]|nr:hypothetical protein [Burkholderiaceae bacterium]